MSISPHCTSVSLLSRVKQSSYKYTETKRTKPLVGEKERLESELVLPRQKLVWQLYSASTPSSFVRAGWLWADAESRVPPSRHASSPELPPLCSGMRPTPATETVDLVPLWGILEGTYNRGVTPTYPLNPPPCLGNPSYGRSQCWEKRWQWTLMLLILNTAAKVIAPLIQNYLSWPAGVTITAHYTSICQYCTKMEC